MSGPKTTGYHLSSELLRQQEEERHRREQRRKEEERRLEEERIAMQQRANTNFESITASLIALKPSIRVDGADLLQDGEEKYTTELHPKSAQLEDRRRERAQEILKRLTDAGLSKFPPQVERLFKEYLTTSELSRVQALEIELMGQIQIIAAQAAQQRADQISANALLNRILNFSKSKDSPIIRTLQDVVNGLIPLQDSFVHVAETLITDLENNQRAALASNIVEGALHDLGYEVEPISETLFAKGGSIYFQQSEWGDYFVKLQVFPERSEINLNIVRPTNEGKSELFAQREDEQMENSWCSANGFPKLMQLLQDRGMNTGILRQVAPGTLPVQVVSPEKIPLRLREKKPAKINNAQPAEKGILKQRQK